MGEHNLQGEKFSGCIDWREDAKRVAMAPHFRSFAMVRGGGYIIRGHSSKAHYLVALEENAQAWGRLYCEGLMRGDVSMLAMRVSTLSYQVVNYVDQCRSITVPLNKVVEGEERAERFVKNLLERCCKSL